MTQRIDFHTHILPQMDDGSRSLEESAAILREEVRQGITTVALTPHFYPGQCSPEAFVQQRQRAWELLKAHWQEELPRLLLGAEVFYFEGIGCAEGMDGLCLEGTNLLLLEMPMCRWTERMLSDIIALQRHRGFQVVLAHIERYLKLQPRRNLRRLLEAGVRMQVNTAFFSHWRTRRKALSMAAKNRIHILGSDCHSMGTRKPNWDRLPPGAAALLEAGEQLLEEHRQTARTEAAITR